jgi:hypothetical protein
VPIHSNPGESAKCPEFAATLITRNGTNILNPQAAARPIPIKIARTGSIYILLSKCFI